MLSSHQSVRALLGAYALDAVDDHEADLVDLHLRACSPCRAELAEYLETVGALTGDHAPAPGALWDGIVAGLQGAPPDQIAGVLVLEPRPARRRLLVAIASVAAVVAALLGFGVVNQQQRIGQVQSELGDKEVLAAALAAQGDPEARRADLRAGDGPVLAHAVLVPGRDGYLWSEGLPDLGPDQTYQLWVVVGNEKISAGVLGPAPQVVPFRVDGDVLGLALTAEAAGGVVVSNNMPVASGLIRED